VAWLKLLSQHLQDGLRITTKTRHHVTAGGGGWYFKAETTEHKAGVPTARPRHSVQATYFVHITDHKMCKFQKLQIVWTTPGRDSYVIQLDLNLIRLD
jgi:hypothetical protein